MFALMLLLMLMSHASVDFIVLSFVLPNCAYAYVASENQALKLIYMLRFLTGDYFSNLSDRFVVNLILVQLTRVPKI